MPEPQVVVGGAVIRNGRLLAARRSAPPETAGRWEFPGGKVEPGERPEDALARELREELGVGVRVGKRLGGESVLRAGLVLRFWVAELADGEPRPLQDHDALRWLAVDELDDVDWLPQDRVVLDEVAPLLGDAAPTV
ncbi:(deoxy)nucleoside triphosphate pyrophosphohydrolase [Streptomyces capparidis]